jgi:Cu2+-exporting ATPase
MFVFFLLGGRYLEMLARQRAARTGDALGRIVPQFARRLSASGDVEEQVVASLVAPGDHVVIRPGEMIVVDGVVLSGYSEVDESWLSGESKPIPKAAGANVLSGSVNGPGSLVVEARQVGESTQFAVVRRLIERASETRPRVVVMADRFAAYFTWILLLLAIGTFAWWWREDAAQALPILVSVLVVSCPCALSLATPISMTIAVHALARRGVLVTRSHAIETLASTSHYVFDKTGTLTEGRQTLNQVLCLPGVEEAAALSIAAALEIHSEHSLARVLTTKAAHAEPARDVRVIPGKGVEGFVRGQRYAVGNRAFVEPWCGLAIPEELLSKEETTRAYLVSETAWLAAFSFSDRVRPGVEGLVHSLKRQGCRLSILSGDADGPVRAVARRLGIDDACASLLPDQKRAHMCRYQAGGETVAMVGDGVNDAPVMAQAHVSIAMAGGTDLARNQADIILLSDEVLKLEWSRQVARVSMAVVRQNLFWALAYNLCVIPAAMMGLVTPWFAGLGMGLSSVLVVLNALRISAKGERLWKAVSTS